MVEQKAVYRAVVVVGEVLAEPADVKTAHALLALVDAAHETDLAVVREEIDGLGIHAFVDQIAIGVLQPPDSVYVLELAHLVRQLLDRGFELGDLLFRIHYSTSLKRFVPLER